MQLPWRREILDGLLGADLVGFQVFGGAQNFLFLSRVSAGGRHVARINRCAVTVR